MRLYTPNQQLMIILPPQSASLIPKKYSRLMYGKLKQYYVHGRIQLDSVDKHARWQHTPFLPIMNDKLIKELVQ